MDVPARKAKAKPTSSSSTSSSTPSITTSTVSGSSSMGSLTNPITIPELDRSGIGSAQPDFMEAVRVAVASGGNSAQTAMNLVIVDHLTKMSDRMAMSVQSPGSGKGQKRKQLEQDMMPVMYNENVTIKDNGVDIIDLTWRHRLRVPNANPSSWWKLKGDDIETFNKSLPIRGSTLYLDHVQGSARPNDVSLQKMHNRSEYVDVKMMTSKNQWVTDKPKSMMFDAEKEHASFGHRWAEPQTCFEVMDGVFNIVNSIYAIRPYSYEGHAILRGLHQCRYFYNVCSGPAEQRKLLEHGVNRVLAKNRTNAIEGEPPLVFKEVVEVFKGLVGEMVPGCPEHLLQTSDPYAGRKSEGHLFFAGTGNGSGAQTNRPTTGRKIDKTPYDEQYRKRMAKEEENERRAKQNRDKFLEKICSAFNSGTCGNQNCNKIHKCSKVVKKMHQGKNKDRVCMEAHPASDHK